MKTVKMVFRFNFGSLRWFVLPMLVAFYLTAELGVTFPAFAATAVGELEGRAAPVARRKCVVGGNLCNEDADCPGSICVDRNVYNISVAVHFNATNAQITAIQDLITDGSEVLYDITDGQAEIGEAFIYNNAFGTNADLRIYPSTNPTWWGADTGSWQTGGSIHVSINNVMAETAPGETLAHEFTHLVFDARDEYESRPVGCLSPSTGGESCPDAATIAAGEESCIMDNGGIGVDGQFTEFCWGQGDPTDLTDISGGNHDATNVTEQSRCRSNRSCWDQVVWSWPNTILMPTGAPDPGTGGGTVNTTQFVLPDSTTRVVLVLDESGSMSLESPSRMERLKVAALDFVTLAENGTELGIVSYSNDAAPASGRVNVPIAPLVADRSPWINAINGLDDYYRTNIGAGLQKAKDMIDAAGGVTANTFIVLMTDGRNNEPAPQATADADLTAKVAALLAAGIPVYVTCTGSDLGLASQCSEIATGTGGFYVDSADAAQLPEAFVDFHEKISGREAIDSAQGQILKPDPNTTFFVEKESESVTFTLLWQNSAASANMLLIDPDGNAYDTQNMPQGRYARIKQPAPGEWRVQIDPRGNENSPYVVRAYSANQNRSLVAAVRYPTVLPGKEIYVYAYPRSLCAWRSHQTEPIKARVTLPDGKTDTLELHDKGRNASGEGDDVPDDGIFTGVYTNTSQKGPYQFHLDSFFDETWHASGDIEKRCDLENPPFNREVRVSAAVGDPTDVELDPEDGFGWCTDRPNYCQKKIAQVPIPWQFWGIVNDPTGEQRAIVIDRIRISPTWLEPRFGEPAGEGTISVRRWVAVSRESFELEELVWDFEKNQPMPELQWALVDKEPVKLNPEQDLILEIPVVEDDRAAFVAYQVLLEDEVVGHFINEALLASGPNSSRTIGEILVNFDIHNETGEGVTNFELDFHGLNFGCGDVQDAIGYIAARDIPPVPVPWERWGADEKNKLVVRPIQGGTEVKWIDPDRPLETCEWLHVGLRFYCNDFDCFNNADKPELRAAVQGYWTIILPEDCDDENPCTLDWCSQKGECINTPVPNGTNCEVDGKLCTVGTCIRGECREEEIICEDDGNLCTRDKCNPQTGNCYDLQPDGTPCYDGDNCTLSVCRNGRCDYPSSFCPDLDRDGDVDGKDASIFAAGSDINKENMRVFAEEYGSLGPQ